MFELKKIILELVLKIAIAPISYKQCKPIIMDLLSLALKDQKIENYPSNFDSDTSTFLEKISTK